MSFDWQCRATAACAVGEVARPRSIERYRLAAGDECGSASALRLNVCGRLAVDPAIAHQLVLEPLYDVAADVDRSLVTRAGDGSTFAIKG